MYSNLCSRRILTSGWVPEGRGPDGPSPLHLGGDYDVLKAVSPYGRGPGGMRLESKKDI